MGHELNQTRRCLEVHHEPRNTCGPQLNDELYAIQTIIDKVKNDGKQAATATWIGGDLNCHLTKLHVDNPEIYIGEAFHRHQAIVESLAYNNMNSAEGDIGEDGAGTYKFTSGIKTRYKLVSDTKYSDQGIRRLDTRGDHRPTTVRRRATAAEANVMTPWHPHPMMGCTPTRTPSDVADVQSELGEAARNEAAAAATCEQPPRDGDTARSTFLRAMLASLRCAEAGGTATAARSLTLRGAIWRTKRRIRGCTTCRRRALRRLCEGSM